MKGPEELFDLIGEEEAGRLLEGIEEKLPERKRARLQARVAEKVGLTGRGARRPATVLRILSAAAVIALAVTAAILIPALTKRAQNGKDNVCQDGMIFVLNDDGVSYKLWDVSESGEDVVIPDTVNGLPVTAVGARALTNCTANSITFSKYVKLIESGFLLNSDISVIHVDKANVAYVNRDNNIVNSDMSSVVIGFVPVISDGISTVGSSAYAGHTKLAKIVLPESVTSIMDHAFAGCSSLSLVDLPAGLKILGSAAFEGCSSLTQIVLPEALSSVPSRAFKDCTSLRSVYIPASLTAIAKDAFEGCTALETVVFGGSEEEWKKLTERSDGGFWENRKVTTVTDLLSGASRGCHTALDYALAGEFTFVGTEPEERLSSANLPARRIRLCDDGRFVFTGKTDVTGNYTLDNGVLTLIYGENERIRFDYSPGTLVLKEEWNTKNGVYSPGTRFCLNGISDA